VDPRSPRWLMTHGREANKVLDGIEADFRRAGIGG
jgi:hypothetical protein